MRIGLDLRYVYPDHVHGIGRYCLELTRTMVAMAPQHEWVAFVREDFGGSVTRLIDVQEIPCPERPVSLGTWFRMGKRIRAQKLDVFHAMFPVVPRRLGDVRTVVTFYDLQAVKEQGFSGGRNALLSVGAWAFYRLAYRHAYETADLVLAISEATAGELTARYGPAPLAVTHAGLPIDMKQPPSEKLRELPPHYGVTPPFLLYVGNYRPHKNVTGLVRAYGQYRRRAGPHALPLVIVGVRDRFFPRTQRLTETLGLALYVHFVGFVPDPELPAFYRSAKVLVNLSLCEGFGFPVLEAMSQGTPVVVANRLSLPEVVGDAGVVVEPDDPETAARAIAALAHDEKRWTHYSQAGRERAKLFTWKRAAKVTLSAYEELNASSKPRRKLAG